MAAITRHFWKIAQTIVWLLGLFMVAALIFVPKLGLHLMWNVLIPVAPLLFVVATGVWRNICPLANTSLMPRKLGLSKKRKLTLKQTGILNLSSVGLLYLLIPLRHAFFDVSGTATAAVLIVLGIIAFAVGANYEWKRAWCSGLCPIHPVEKLYGSNAGHAIKNAHCISCQRCTTPCPDSTPGINPLSITKTWAHKWTGLLLVGGFPGFIWGWFHVQNLSGTPNILQVLGVYGFPVLCATVTGILFYGLEYYIPRKKLTAIFAAVSISCYYWYRLPALFGYGLYPGDGMLVDLSNMVALWPIQLISTLFAAFFFWRLVFQKRTSASWAIRPNYA